MKASRILFIAQEVNPYVPESHITELGRKVPLGAMGKGREVRAFMPKWGNINERRNQLHEVIRLSGVNMVIERTDYPLIIKVASLVGTRMQIYFIDNDELFSRRLQECDASGAEYEDNVERMVFYARGAVETAKKLRWIPDIIHCQGWIASLVPLYLRTAYASEAMFRNSRIVYTQCDNRLTRPTGEHFRNILGLGEAGEEILGGFGDSLTPQQVEMLAIKCADGVSFHSPEPNPELVEYARREGKTIMEGDFDAGRYVEFFDTVWSKGKSEVSEQQ